MQASSGSPPPRNAERDAREAQALRANLRRRKAQAQLRRDDVAAAPEPQAAPDPAPSEPAD